MGDHRVPVLKRVLAVMMWFGAATVAFAQCSAFHFISSPQSLVGGGQTLHATPTNGYNITAFRSGTVRFLCDNTNASSLWSVELQAPNDELLTEGIYFNAQRATFVDPGLPGLDFRGEGRGNNTLKGWFQVLEVNYDTDTNLLTLAVDFVQYDNENALAWNEGSVRFNSSVPIPQPLLFAVHAGTNIILSWPLLGSGFTLYGTTNLDSAQWSPLSNRVTNDDGTISVTLPATATSEFYRLARYGLQLRR